MDTTIKTETIRARVTPQLKQDAEEVLEAIGMSTTEAITVFLKQVIMRKGLPFDVRIPNRTTRKVLQEIQEGRGLIKSDLEELRREFE